MTGHCADGENNSAEHRAMDAKMEELYGNGHFQKWASLVLGLGNASDAVEIMCVSYILKEKEFDDVSDWEKGALAAGVFAGMFVGGLICGLFGDRMGRRPLLMAALAINCIAAVVSAFSPDIYWLTAFRIIAGIGVGGSVPCVFALISEYAPPSNRGWYVISITFFWMFGSIFVAGLAWVMMGGFGFSWRPFAAACGVPAALSLLMMLRMPESPYFLLTKGKFVHLNRALCSIGKWNNVTHHFSEFHLSIEQFVHRFQDNVDSPSRSSDLVTDPMLPEAKERQSQGSSLVSLEHPLTDPVDDEELSSLEQMKVLLEGSLFVPTVCLCIAYFSLSFGFYGLSVWMPSLFEKVGFDNSVYEDTFFFAAANLPGNIGSLYGVDHPRIGPKRLLVGCMLLSAFFVILFGFVTDSLPGAITISCLFSAMSTAGWNGLTCVSVSPDLFPTHVRGTAVGFLTAAGRVGSIAAQFVNSSLMDHVTMLLFTSGITLLLGAFAVMFIKVDVTMGKNDKVKKNDDNRISSINNWNQNYSQISESAEI